MAITLHAVGALSQHQNTITPTLPATPAANQLAILAVMSGTTGESTPSQPAGWDLVGTLSGGGGAFGLDAGPRRLTVFARVLKTGDTAPTTAIPTETNGLIAGRIVTLDRSAGTGWRYSMALAEDTSSGTSFSAVAVDSVAFAPGDFIVSMIALMSDAPTTSAEGATATGVTFGAFTEQADDAITSGHDGRLVIATSSVSTGTTMTAPTITGTLSVAGTGVAALLSVDEASATLTAVVQSSDPPRVLVTLSGMLAENEVTAIIQRLVSGVATTLRAADSVDVTGTDALVRTDAEQPFGVTISYQALLTDALGYTWVVTSNSVITNIDHEVLSDAVGGIGVNVQIIEWREKTYTRESTTFNVNGRLVVVSGPQPGATSTLTVFTETTADRLAMLRLLEEATDGIILIRTQATTICLDDPGYDPLAQVDSYLAVLSSVLERAAKFRYPQRNWELSVAEVEAWPSNLEARGWTLGDIDTWYTNQSLGKIDTDFVGGTMLSLDTFDWGV